MKKNEKSKTAEEKAKIVDGIWDGKKSKVKTLTGKRASEIRLHPETKHVGNDGLPMKKLTEEKVGVIAVGRMNPPTKGHETLVEKVSEIAEEVNGIPILFLSKAIGKNDPLTFNEKKSLVIEAFSDLVAIAEDPISNIIEMLQSLNETYDTIIWVTGDDQLESSNRILKEYNGKEFDFKYAVAVSAGVRNPDSTLFVESLSATTMRNAVKSADIEAFSKGLPSKLQAKALDIFEMVLFGLSLYDKNAKTLSESVKEKIAQYRFRK